MLLRPRFSWDIKNDHWTDRHGDQVELAEAVNKWGALHYNLPDINSNKISKVNQGIVLQSHLYGRACDLCKSISIVTISSKNGVAAIVNAIHKRDPLTVVFMAYLELIRLMSTYRNAKESFRDIGSTVRAQLSWIDALAAHIALCHAMLASMLLANSNVDSGQRVSILAAASPVAHSVVGSDTTDSILQ